MNVITAPVPLTYLENNIPRSALAGLYAWAENSIFNQYNSPILDLYLPFLKAARHRTVNLFNRKAGKP
ncbi:hypothetical protein YS91_20795 [Salmonella enterica subsp. enterica]|nr:hypothetical protein [Salmonella enterica subsp. enterica serovar Richmond]